MSNSDNDDKADWGNDSAPVAPYKVGYKKPPLHTQFKPGQSGNPSGLAKIPSNFKESSRDGERQAGQKVPVGVAREGGGHGRHYKGNAVQEAGIVLPSTVRATLNGKAFDWQSG